MSDPLSRLYTRVPALGVLRTYRFAHARADFLAGLTVAAVAVPQAMAYGLVAGVPPVYGLYTAIVLTAVGALFDSSRHLVNGPTNATSIAVLSATAMFATEAERVQAAITLAFLVGAIQLGITVLKLGDLTRYISHSVIVGFTAGAGTLLVLEQLKNLLGLPGVGDPHDPFVVRFWRTMFAGNPVHLETLGVGLGTIALILGLRWLKARLRAPLVPELLIAVVAMAALTLGLGLEERGVQVIGDIPASLPPFQLPHLDGALVRELSSSALAIAVLGLLEALSMAKAIAAHTGQRLDLNQQCLSDGLANFVGGFFQCIPGSGSLTRSAINQQAGAQSQWAAIWSAAAVAIIMLVFAPHARFIPKAALAGLLMVSAWRMVDRKALLYHARATRFDAIIVAATAISAVAISIEFCILIGVLLSFMLAVPRAGRMLLSEFVITGAGTIHERLPEDEPCPQLRIFGLEGEMFFGATTSLEQHFDHIEAALGPETEVLVLRVKRARNPDAVGLHLLEGFLERMAKRGVTVLLCGVKPEMHRSLERAGVTRRFPQVRLFLEQPVRQTSTLLAIRHAYTLLHRTCAACPRKGGPDAAENGLYFVV